MKANIKIIILSGLLIFSGLFISQKSSAQVGYSDELDKNRLVYWFYVSVKEVKNSNTGYVSYDIKRKGPKISHGTIKVYDRELWRYLSNGSKMAIGPFNDFEEAKRAYYFYDIQEEPHILNDSFDPDQTVFWFILHVKKLPRSGALKLVRKPGAIASGNYNDFDIFLRENLKMRVMTVGPFLYMTEAEEAKRTYRLH